MLTKDIAGRTTHTLKRAVRAFGKTFGTGTEVKFRPLQVMRLHGELQIGETTVFWTRSGCSLNDRTGGQIAVEREASRDDLHKLVNALDPPAADWTTAQYEGDAPSPWEVGALS